MPHYFFDSSALAKAYHFEAGTSQIEAIFARHDCDFFISSLTVIEIQSVFSQKVRERKLSEIQYQLLKKRFASDIRMKKLRVRNLVKAHQKAAEALLEIHARFRRLRTLDAIQLAVALELQQTSGLDLFVCADKSLVEVALMEGLSVLNPNNV